MPDRDERLADAAPPAPTLVDLLRDYTVPAGYYDEVRDPSGSLRPHWAAFTERTGRLTADDLSREQKRLARQLQENGVTYNIHSAGGPARVWSLDVLPYIVPASEWADLSAGLRQRARLLEAVAADIYGPQTLLDSGLVPPALVLQHPGFLRQVHGIAPAQGSRLHVLAFDIARDAHGRWLVMDARTQAPSGAGYALENRLSISQLYPDAFREQHVALLAPFFRMLRETLLENAPCPAGTPHVVLLTPGPYAETYFEHSYLARYLGFTLAEGADLTVREDRVYLKTVGGLRPVHAILRRLDDDFCDPLELRAESSLGVPGLVQAWRAGHVLLANALGVGILESPVLQPYLGSICERLFGEPLRLPSVGAIWARDSLDLEGAMSHLETTVIKPAFPEARAQAILGPRIDAVERRAWRDRLRADPDRFVLEDLVPLSHVPTSQNQRLESRALMWRVFLVSDGDGDYTVMPGGLARIAGTERLLVSGARGGGSKDTWVLSDGPVERVSLLPGRLRADDVVRSERVVSSRAAEHLFWMGRYAERSENAARLMRAVLTRIHYGAAVVSSDSPPIVKTCTSQGLLGRAAPAAAGAKPEAVPLSSQEFEATLIRGLFDPVTLQSVRYDVEQTGRVAAAVRDRLSTDNWRELTRLAEMLGRRRPRHAGLSEALEVLDRVIMSLVAVGGLEMAHMTRDDGWRFMSLGRHIERLLYVTTTVAEVASTPSMDDPTLLEWLLDVSDSIITYRARYMGRAEWLAVTDLLLFDPRNPRSAVFQLSKIAKHAPLLPEADLGTILPTLERLAGWRTGNPTTPDLFAARDSLPEFLETSERISRHLSDALTLRYFSHVYEPAHATLL